MAAKKQAPANSVLRDRKLVAGEQEHEVRYEAWKSNASTARVKAARNAVGASRVEIRKNLRGR